MSLFANAAINRLQVHAGLRHLSDSIGAGFAAVFLLKQGFSPAAVFLTFAAMFATRFALRGLVITTAARIGLRRTLIVATPLYSLQFLALAQIAGPGAWVGVYVAVAALGDVFYWTVYHTVYACAGQEHDRGRQLGAREIISQTAAIAGPIAGGAALSLGGPGLAFGLAFAIGATGVLPLFGIGEVRPALQRPPGVWPSARGSFLLFATDGWIVKGSRMAWSLAVFQALGERYDAFGAALSGAALAGAVAVFAFGRSIDRGHGYHAVLTGGLCLGAIIFLQALTSRDAMLASLVLIAGAALGNLYMAGLMTTIYGDAKAAPCPLRFTYYAEGGWDTGATAACLVCAGMMAFGWPLAAAILLGLPAAAVQTLVLLPRFGRALVKGAAS